MWSSNPVVQARSLGAFMFSARMQRSCHIVGANKSVMSCHWSGAPTNDMKRRQMRAGCSTRNAHKRQWRLRTRRNAMDQQSIEASQGQSPRMQAWLQPHIRTQRQFKKLCAHGSHVPFAFSPIGCSNSQYIREKLWTISSFHCQWGGMAPMLLVTRSLLHVKKAGLTLLYLFEEIGNRTTKWYLVVSSRVQSYLVVSSR